MNFLDILLAIPLIYCIWKGYKRGIIFELAAFVGIVAGGYAAVHFSTFVADKINPEGESTVLVAFFITFLGVVVLSFFFGKCIQGLVKLIKAGTLDKILGAVLGMAKCVIILSILLNYINLIDQKEVILKPNIKEESRLYSPVEQTGNKMVSYLKEYVAEKRNELEQSKSHCEE